MPRIDNTSSDVLNLLSAIMRFDFPGAVDALKEIDDTIQAICDAGDEKLVDFAAIQGPIDICSECWEKLEHVYLVCPDEYECEHPDYCNDDYRCFMCGHPLNRNDN